MPPEKLARLCAVGVALDEIISADALDAVAIRCWNEMETTFGIAPCLLLSELSDRFVEGVCETDICNAAVMRLLRLGAERPAVCLDWNNNYGDEPDKCILFHCGPVAGSLMRGKGKVTDHSILANSFGAGCGWGCNQGRIADFPMTYASAKTENGRFALYLGEGHFTDDPIDGNYFGCAGVAEIPGLQQKLIRIGREGYKHHMSAAPGHFARALREACEMCLGYDIAAF